MSKDFDNWNICKKEIQIAEANKKFFCNEREIWWCSLGVNLGIETDGKNENFDRPVLIIKVFNRDMVWVLPISTSDRSNAFHYKFDYDGQEQSIILSQLRTISTKRLFRRIKLLDEADFSKIVERVKGFLGKRNPAKAGNLGGRSPNNQMIAEPIIKSTNIVNNMQKIILNTDGWSRGNPGPAGAGVVVSSATGEILKKAHLALGVMTNNEAEYRALIFGLETLKKQFGKDQTKNLEVEIRMDSELIVKQINGQYQIKEKNLQPFFMEIWNARVKDFPHLTFRHIPREENSEADKLANQAMDGR